MAESLPVYIDGGFRQSAAENLIPVTNPATQDVLVHAPQTTMKEIDEAVAASKVAKNVTPAVTLNSVVLVKDPEKNLVVGAGVVDCAETLFRLLGLRSPQPSLDFSSFLDEL